MKDERKKELKKIKELIKEYYNLADCGIYNTRNVVGDELTTLYRGKYFTLDICFGYSYYEILGMTLEEFNKLEKYYNRLKHQEEE